jgi:hypothetical protein
MASASVVRISVQFLADRQISGNVYSARLRCAQGSGSRSGSQTRSLVHVVFGDGVAEIRLVPVQPDMLLLHAKSPD